MFAWLEDEAGYAGGDSDGAPGSSPEWYRIGEAFLGIRSDDRPFADGFRDIYGDCGVGAAGRGPAVRCSVRAHPARPLAVATFADPEPLDAAAFVVGLFPDRGYAVLAGAPAPWRMVGRPEEPEAAWAFAGERVLVRRDRDWHGLIANCAVHRAIRLQRDVVFLHAGSAAVGDRGTLLVGSKGSGKTTLSLAMAALGCGFLGDEIAAVHLGRREVLPVQRSVSVRDGPRHAEIGRRLDGVSPAPVRLADGSTRLRARPSRLVPGALCGGAPLRAVVFLTGFASTPAIARLPMRPELVTRLNPIGSTLWGVGAAARVFRLLQLLSGSALFALRAGAPEPTAELLAATLETA